MPIITLRDVHKAFGSEVVFDNLSQRFYANEKVGMIGPNGSGKTTLLKLILGTIEPDMGNVVRRKGLRIGYLPQEPVFDGRRTVMEEMHLGAEEALALQRRLDDLTGRLGHLSGSELDAAMVEYDRLHVEFELAGGYEYETKIRRILTGLELEEGLFNANTSALSGGQLSRLGLAKVLLSQADLLLLDEPTNHLDLQATVWLEKFLKNCPAATVVISHDRYLLDSIATRIVEVENRQATSYKGNYSNYVTTRDKMRLEQERLYASRRKMVEKTRDSIARNKDKEGMRKTARGREKRLDKLLAKDEDFLSRPGQRQNIAFTLGRGQSRSDLVLRSESLSKAFGSLVLFEEMTFDLLSGERLGITGPNGTGKSTLLKMALGQTEPTAGTIKMGPALARGYLDQHGKELDRARTVLEEAAAVRPDLAEEALRTRLGAFLFTGEDVFKETGQLSGGQQNRLMLCKLVLAEPDVLILDEPTNHLDIPGKEMLEVALQQYQGTIIVVSHDRFFLDRLANKLLVIGADKLGQRQLGRFEFVSAATGVYSRYAELLGERAAEQQDGQETKRLPTKRRRTAPAKTTANRATPKELRKYNKFTIEEIEKTIMELEEEIDGLREEFGDERMYQNPALLAQHREAFENKQKQLELLYRAYESRGG